MKFLHLHLWFYILGTIESRPYPLLLGSCGTVPSFKGFIDDVSKSWSKLSLSQQFIFENRIMLDKVFHGKYM